MNYKTIEENYDLIKKYYLMAISEGDINAMKRLSGYYKTTEEILMKKYYRQPKQ